MDIPEGVVTQLGTNQKGQKIVMPTTLDDKMKKLSAARRTTHLPGNVAARSPEGPQPYPGAHR